MGGTQDERIRVAIDARRLQDPSPTGVSRFLANLVDRLATRVDLVLFTDARRPAPITDLPVVAVPALRGGREIAWIHQGVRRRLRSFDGIFHGTFNAIPFFTPVPSVITIHDLAVEVHPEDHGAFKRRYFQLQLRYAVRAAKAILTVSQFSARQISERYEVDPAQIFVAPHAVDPAFSPGREGAVGPVLHRLGVEPPYVVALGGARRRGLPVAIGAWQRARSAGLPHPLVVVGREAPAPVPGVVYAGRLEDDEWSAVLAGGDAFVYPTRYEGFGMPALEAAASGTPVVAAPVGPLPEILGDAAQWCDEPSAEALGRGLVALLGDRATVMRLREAGLARAATTPTWDDAADRHLEAYRIAASGTARR